MNKLSSGSSEDRDFQDKILMYFWSNITDYKTLSAQEINKYANQFVEMPQLREEIKRMSLIKKTVEQQKLIQEKIEEEKKEEQKAKEEAEKQA